MSTTMSFADISEVGLSQAATIAAMSNFAACLAEFPDKKFAQRPNVTKPAKINNLRNTRLTWVIFSASFPVPLVIAKKPPRHSRAGGNNGVVFLP